MLNKVYKKYDGIYADQKIKVCNKCSKCWEKTRIGISEGRTTTEKDFIIFYEDFPTYGKMREICPKCNNKTKHAQMFKGLILHEVIKS